MPPKDMRPHELLFSADNGKTYQPMAHITDVPEMVVPDGLSENEMFDFQFPQEMTITVNISHKPYWILAMFGDTKSIPNNWLKMHRLPMRRGKRLKIYGLRMKRRRK